MGLVPPAHPVPGERPDDHADQRPSNQDRNDVKGGVPGVEQQAREEEVLRTAGPRRDHGGNRDTDESRHRVLERFTPRPTEDGEGGTQADGHPGRELELATGHRVDDHEEEAGEARVGNSLRSAEFIEEVPGILPVGSRPRVRPPPFVYVLLWPRGHPGTGF